MSNSIENTKTDRIHCNTCGRETNHSIKGSYKTHWSDEERDISAGGTHELLMCNGCETPALRSIEWFSEEEGRTYGFHPPRNSNSFIRFPKQYTRFRWGTPVESAYRQTISAYNQQLFILAGAGVRLMLEGLCKELSIVDGPVVDNTGNVARKNNLEGKINGLAEGNYISSKQVSTLHEIRFLGNESAHELYQPSDETVRVALDILEHIVEQVYEQPAKEEQLKNRKLQNHW